MATRRETNTFTPSTEELALIVNNGDLVSLRDTMNRLGFKDEASIIRFALAVLAQAATRSVTVTNQNNTRVSLSPSEDLLQPSTEQAAG